MKYISTQKFLPMSPRKLRVVAEMLKKLNPGRAVEILPHLEKKGAEPLLKVIKSALANASVKGVNRDDLVFEEIQIGEGPRLKRGRPASRGRWHPYKRRMSHIRVVLTARKSEALNPKSETINNDQNSNFVTRKTNTMKEGGE